MRVLILLQRPEAWVNVASVWSALRARSDFEPHVLALPYNVEDAGTSTHMMARSRALLHANEVPFEEWHAGQRPEDGRFDAVIINHPYDRERPLDFRFDLLAAAIPTTIYIPYGLSMGGGRKNLRLQFAQPTQIGATAVVVRSAYEKRMYALHCPAGDAHVHVLGHPRFDAIRMQLAAPIPIEMTEAIGDRVTILWNSHFSFARSYSQSSNFSTFDLIGPELFEYTKAHREQFCLLWRPHPGLFPVILREELLTRGELDALRAELVGIGMVLDESANHIAAFGASDAIITDVGSFLLEYLVTGKPILALINPEGEPLNEESTELVSRYPTASRAEDVIAFIEKLRVGEEFPARATARSEHLPGLDGCAGQRVARMIYELVTGETRSKEIPLTSLPSIPPAGPRQPVKMLGNPTPVHSVLPETPVLDRLVRGLRQLRDRKAREPKWRKQSRSIRNTVRTSLGETVKQSPALMRVAESLRMFGKRR